MSTIDAIQESIDKIDKRRAELRELIAPYQEELNTTRQEREQLVEARDQLLIESQETNWEWLLEHRYDLSTARYKFRQKKLQEIGLSSDGYEPKTMQATIQVSIPKQGSYQKTLDGLQLVLPFIKPIAGEKIINLFEHTLSRYGSYVLIVTKKKVYIQKYGSSYNRQYFHDLKKAFDYIQNHHWYGESDEEESD